MEPLFLHPILKERIWGGTALATKFGYELPSNTTGECWGISAHPHGPSTVKNGHYEGMKLDELWKKHPEIFGHSKHPEFPFLTKIIDAEMDLSVQVHPDDAYAKKHNGDLGKTECWYILDCAEDAKLILGHHALTKEEFHQKVKAEQWDSLLQKVSIKPGDFFYVPSGTIHAIGKGTLVLETQQSSDTTYRVYDFDRKDEKGNKRDLHLEHALEVTTVPHEDQVLEQKKIELEAATVTTLVQSSFFSVFNVHLNGKQIFEVEKHYMLCSITEGSGVLTYHSMEYPLQKGMHFILPVKFGHFEVRGELEAIVSHE